MRPGGGACTRCIQLTHSVHARCVSVRDNKTSQEGEKGKPGTLTSAAACTARARVPGEAHMVSMHVLQCVRVYNRVYACTSVCTRVQ
jgi:hypothetical protein